MPFQRSSDILKRLTAGSLSAEGIRQKIAAKAKVLVLRDDVSGKTVLTDSTKVKAGIKERGPRYKWPLPPNQGRWLPDDRRSGKSWFTSTSRWLNRSEITWVPFGLSAIVHDGDTDFSGCADSVQRCRWHLVYQLKHYLWQDDIPHEDRAIYPGRLKDILFGERSTARGC